MRKSILAAGAAAALVAGVGTAGSAAALVAGVGGNTANKATRTTSVAPALVVPRAFLVSTGTGVLRSRGAVSFLRLGTGIYDVRFSGSIARCAWTGTTGFGTFSGSLPNGSGISVTGRAGTNNGLFVQTYVGSTSTDLPFTVLVVCS